MYRLLEKKASVATRELVFKNENTGTIDTMVKFEENYIILKNTIKKIFDFNIRQVLEYDNTLIILLEIPFDNNNIKDNVLSIDFKGNTLWVIKNEQYSENIYPMEQMYLKENNLYASDFYGRCLKIDLKTGHIKEVLQSK